MTQTTQKRAERLFFYALSRYNADKIRINFFKVRSWLNFS